MEPRCIGSVARRSLNRLVALYLAGAGLAIFAVSIFYVTLPVWIGFAIAAYRMSPPDDREAARRAVASLAVWTASVPLAFTFLLLPALACMIVGFVGTLYFGARSLQRLESHVSPN
jgi:hypothetical protein